MITLINGLPQSPDGLIVPNGSIGFQLNVDATVIAAPFGYVSASIEVVFQFNSVGLIQPNNGVAAQIYSNAELNPQNNIGLGTYYLVTFYDANGARINKNPMWWQFPEATGATVDISNMTPISTVGGNVIFYPTNFAGGGGTVTSVSLTGDGTIFSSTPSTPVTTAGTLTPTLLTQSANTVLAGPTTGAATTPTFRALVSADLPATINIWSALAAPIADLVLATTTFNTTFSSTVATTWKWSNLTAATSLLNQDSPALELSGQAWISSASDTVTFKIQEHLGALYFTQIVGPSAIFPYQFDAGLQIAGAGLMTPLVNADFQAAGAGSVFVLSQAGNASAGLTVYTGTIPAGAGPVFGMRVTIAGFASGVNNGSFLVHDSTLTTLTVYNGSGSAETHSGTATVDSSFYNANGFGIALGNNATSFPIEGTSYAAIVSSQPFPYSPAVAISVKGNATDAAYLRIIADGATGNHGLEIGGIIDGTGVAPVTLQLGVFSGIYSAIFNTPISYGAAGANISKTSIKVSVTSAQLKALPGTTFNLIPAPGANKIILVDSFTFQYKFVTTAYTLGNTDNLLGLIYTGTSIGFSGGIPADGTVNQTANAIGWQDWSQNIGTTLLQSNQVNKGVDLTITGTTPALTLGDGTAVIWIEYTVIDVS